MRKFFVIHIDNVIKNSKFERTLNYRLSDIIYPLCRHCTCINVIKYIIDSNCNCV